jgi:DNA-binding transcriptional ArsR family regulator
LAADPTAEKAEREDYTLTYEHMLMYSWDVTTQTVASHAVRDEELCAADHAHDQAILTALAARLLGDSSVQAVAEVFKLLGDPTRVRLVDALSHGERCVCDLATLVQLSESAVSHQLRLLRAARLVRVRRAGRLAYYSLDDHHVVGLLHDTRKHVEEATP